MNSSSFVVQSKKRGLSLEEKREKMLQIFYESQNFFLVSLLFVTGEAFLFLLLILFWDSAFTLWHNCFKM